MEATNEIETVRARFEAQIGKQSTTDPASVATA